MNPRDDRSTLPAPSPPSDDWAIRLIRHTARRSPASLSERLEEEWLADLHEHSGSLSRLRFALGCCRASWVIANDPIVFGASVARAASSPGAVAAYAPRGDSGLSRRTIALLLIAGLHVFVIYGFSVGLGTRVIATLPESIKGKFIDDRPQPEPLPPTPVRTLEDSPRMRPDLERLLPGTIGPITYREEILLPPVEPPAMPPEPAPVRRVVGGPASGFPSTGDFYPALSRTLGESGVAAVQVCVDRNGRLTADPQIRQSSGSVWLDAGALALAKAGSGHYRSTTENGRPVASCYPFRIRFELRK